MSDFTHRNPDVPPEPIDPPPSAFPEPYEIAGDTPMTARQYEAAEPLAQSASEADSTPMTAPSWTSGAAEGWEEPEQPPAVPDADLDSLTGEGKSYIEVDQEPALRRHAIIATAAWLGPRLAELEHPPDADNLIDLTPEPDGQRLRYGPDDAELADDLATGWRVAVGIAPFPESDALTRIQDDVWAAAVTLLPSGKLAYVEGFRFRTSTTPQFFDPGAAILPVDEQLLNWRDDELEREPELAEDRGVTFLTSRSVAEMLNTFIGRLGLSDEELRRPPPNQPAHEPKQ